MEINADIAVIGGGWAGFAAALQASKRGAKVVLVQKGTGATGLSSGAIDVADAPLRPHPDPWEDSPPLESLLRSIFRFEPSHPYSLLSRRFGEGPFLDFLKGALRQTTQALPLAYVGDLDSNRLHATPLGTLKATALVQRGMEEGNLWAMRQAKVLVVGIRGYPAFHSRFVKEALMETQTVQKNPHLFLVGNLDLEIHGLEGKSSLSAFEIAQRLDQEETFVRFGQAIYHYVHGKVYTHLLLPPVMGVINHELILLALRKITGLQAAETLAAPLSVPGYRLDRAIRAALSSLSVECVTGEVVGYDSEHRQLKSLRVHAGTHRVKVEAKGFVLATGKFIGGGASQCAPWRDTVFHLPLVELAAAKNTSFRPEGSSFFSPQPFFNRGLKTNDLLQPLSEEETVVFENLFAAGSLLSGCDFSREAASGGLSIVTGAYAGLNAAAFAK
ncbi:MAG: anaerobic glycerol-3-phosphate dehydrogenase subunit GlpB [bacterium]